MNERHVSWFQVPFMWLVVGIPVTAIAVGLGMLGFSIASFDGVVVDDYYKRGKEINRVLARDRNASALGVSANLKFDIPSGKIFLNIDSKAELTLPDQIDLLVLHPTQSGKDEVIKLKNVYGKSYIAPLPALAKSRWYFQLGTDQWRLTTTAQLPVSETIGLHPLVD